jgi:hypothetical protein
MADTLVQKIIDSLTSGKLIAYQDIIDQFPQPTNPLKVDVGQTVSAIEQLAGLIQGGSILAIVPPTLLPKGPIALQSVSFTLDLDKKLIDEVDCTVAFGQDGKGVGWDIADIGTADLNVTLITLAVKWIASGDASGITASGTGSTSLAGLTLDVAAAYPQPTVTCTQVGSVNVGDFFQKLGLTSLDFLQALLIEKFKLTYSFAKSQASLSSSAVGKDGKPVPLIPGILAFDQMTFAFNSAGAQTSASIAGQLLVSAPGSGDARLVLNAKADCTANGDDWNFTASLPTSPPVTAADLAKVFGNGASAPGAISGFTIASLSLDYAYTKKDGGSTYTINGAFKDTWTVADLSAQVSVTLSNAKTATNVVTGKFAIEDVTFALSYTFGKDSSKFDAKIVSDLLAMSGDYTPGDGTIELSFDKVPSLADFISWFVGEVSDNRYYTLSDPWDDVLSAVTLQGVSFKIQLAQKQKDKPNTTITCSVPINKSILGFTLESFDITYDPSTASGRRSSGLSVTINSNLPSWVTDGNWDPGTQPPPTVPGSKTSLLDIKLLAAGQHIGFPVPPPVTVEAAINQLVTALDPSSWKDGLYPAGLAFSPDIGWLIGTHVGIFGREDSSSKTFKYQLDLQFIFSDPNLYGLRLAVDASDKTSALYALNGLIAEIIYRKISDTVGVYEGTLTLPSDIRTINLNQVVITLPQFSVSIYTNGDFSFDAGFPYNRDFSQSLQVVAAEYAGAGGFYYAKLDGLDPAGLPPIPPDQNGQPSGVFSPVTEIGIGFEIGASKGFSSGPLSASASIMLLGIFQGVFAKYTRYKDGAQDEFYSVDATLGIVGHLVGEIDFVIITATLEVTISIEADLKLIAHQQTVASIEVYVDVELTVSINCGLFSIHIHCGFSTTLRTQASFGSSDTAIWDSVGPQAHPLQLGDDTPFSIGWQPIADSNTLTLYFMPQLTAGALYPPNGQQTAWYYVGQLGLSNPASDTVNTDQSYANFVSGMLLWALHAIRNTTSDTPVPRVQAETNLVTAKDVQDLNDALKDKNNPSRPTIDIIRQQFSSAFGFNVVAMDVPQGKYGVGFFPAVPGLSVMVQPEGQPAITRAPAMVSPAQLQQARSGGSAAAPRATFLAHLRDQPNALSATEQPVPDLVLIDFAVLAITSALGKIIEKGIIPDKQSMTIKAVIAAVQPELGNISGMTTRFMLHGTRQKVGDVTEPLYALLGQQVQLNAAALAAANLTMTLSFATGKPVDWGMTFPGGANTLSLSSSDKNAAVFKPKTQIPSTPQFTPSNVVGGLMPLDDHPPVSFYLKTGIVDSGSQSVLWQLPQALADHLAQGIGNETAKVYQYQPKDATVQPTTVAANFVFTLDFRVRRIPATDGSSPNLPNTYELVDVDQGSLQSLQTLVTAKTSPVTGLALACAVAANSSGGTSRQAQITPIDFSTNNTFIVQSNFSTQTNPPPSDHPVLGAALSPSDAAKINLFLTKLWTAGITNSGGYFLFDTAVPDEVFDGNGRATLTLVANLFAFDGTNPVSLAPYVTGVQILDANVASGAALYVALYIDGKVYTEPRAMLPAGNVGVEATCDAPPPPPMPSGGAGDYGNALDHLYNLITAESISLTTYDDAAPVFGPVNPKSNQGDATTWRYRHVFPLVATWPQMSTQWPTDAVPPPQYNPYSTIGQDFSFDLRWTDIFGNEWPVSVIDPAKLHEPLQYTDSLVSLSQLPYLTLDYRFDDPGSGAQLAVDFTVSKPSYQNSVGDNMRKASDLASYAQAYFQLGDANFAVTITSSLLVVSGQPALITVAVDTIRKNVLALYDYLLACPLGGQAPDVPTLDPITVPAPPSGVEICHTLKFPLTVELTFARPKASVAAPFLNGPVETVSTTIAPYTAAAANDPHSLVPFAQDFEKAFKAQDLAIAVGPSAGQGLTANSRQVWVVRYGNSGITIDFPKPPPDKLGNFAPRPLSNQLQSRTVKVRQIDAQGNLSPPDFNDASGVAVTNVDLDAQMQKFLSAVDLMFSATDAIPTALINPDAIDDLAKSKQTIATNLINYVTDLQSGDSWGDGGYDPNDPISAAADRYKQECLIRLSAFYDMDAVTVPTVTATFGTSVDPGLYVFGHLKVKDPSAQNGKQATDPSPPTVETEFTLTSGKCALATAATPMAIGLYAKHVSQYSEYACQPSFVIDAIQHDVTPVPIDGATYDVGPWLTFVIPRDDVGMQPLAVPIALRAFPQPPQLMAQTAVELIADPSAPASDDDANLRLMLAKTWALDGSYQHTYAAQDTVHLKVEINIAPPSTAFPMVGATVGRDLIETLIEFNLNYAQLQSIFADNHLDKVRTPGDAKKGILFNALSSFKSLVAAVAGANWPAKQQQATRRAVGDALVAQESQYQIHDGYKVKANSDPWKCAVEWEQDLKDPVGFIPQLQIDNWKTVLDPDSEQSDTELIYAFVDPNNPNTYLLAEQAEQIQTRTVAAMPPYEYLKQKKPFTPLDIVNRQNGLLSMMIGRNEGLPAPFQYQTPWVTYTEIIAPTLDTAVPIDIAGIGQPNGQAAPRSIVDHLTALFTALMTVAGNPKPFTLSFQAIMYFAYPPNAPPAGAESLALVELPIALRLPTGTDTPGYVADMAKTITDWLTANGLSDAQRHQLWQRSQLRFDLSLFSDASLTARPTLRLRSLFIQCSDIVA